MPYREPAFYIFAVRVVLPPILGGIGAVLAASLPLYYEALCRSPMVPLHAVLP